MSQDDVLEIHLDPEITYRNEIQITQDRISPSRSRSCRMSEAFPNEIHPTATSVFQSRDQPTSVADNLLSQIDSSLLASLYVALVKKRYSPDRKPITVQKVCSLLAHEGIKVEWDDDIGEGIHGRVYKGTKEKLSDDDAYQYGLAVRRIAVKHHFDLTRKTRELLDFELYPFGNLTHVHLVSVLRVWGPVLAPVDNSSNYQQIARDLLNVSASEATGLVTVSLRPDVVPPINGLYSLMPLVEGGTLDNWMSEIASYWDYTPNGIDYVRQVTGRQSEPFVKCVVEQTCEALVFCHRRDICHNDLHLQNLLLDKHGTVKLIDMSLASTPPGAFLKNPQNYPETDRDDFDEIRIRMNDNDNDPIDDMNSEYQESRPDEIETSLWMTQILAWYGQVRLRPQLDSNHQMLVRNEELTDFEYALKRDRERQWRRWNFARRISPYYWDLVRVVNLWSIMAWGVGNGSDWEDFERITSSPVIPLNVPVDYSFLRAAAHRIQPNEIHLGINQWLESEEVVRDLFPVDRHAGHLLAHPWLTMDLIRVAMNS